MDTRTDVTSIYTMQQDIQVVVYAMIVNITLQEDNANIVDHSSTGEITIHLLRVELYVHFWELFDVFDVLTFDDV